MAAIYSLSNLKASGIRPARASRSLVASVHAGKVVKIGINGVHASWLQGCAAEPITQDCRDPRNSITGSLPVPAMTL